MAWGLLVFRFSPQLSRSNILKNKKAYYIYLYIHNQPIIIY
nr:MAG TPA: outer membrane protein [Bacteriophage sp.]